MLPLTNRGTWPRRFEPSVALLGGCTQAPGDRPAESIRRENSVDLARMLPERRAPGVCTCVLEQHIASSSRGSFPGDSPGRTLARILDARISEAGLIFGASLIRLIPVGHRLRASSGGPDAGRAGSHAVRVAGGIVEPHHAKVSTALSTNPSPNQKTFLSDFDGKFLSILGNRFMHNRESLRPLIDRVAHRGTMVEVGSLCGFSTAFFAARFDRVISIDPYSPGYDPEDLNSVAPRLQLAQQVFRLRFFDDPRVTQHNETSEVGAKRFEDRSLDFVYIDAGHAYDAVKHDVSLWLPKVREDSWIAGDDYEWRDGCVRQAIEEAFSHYDVIENRWIARVADAR